MDSFCPLEFSEAAVLKHFKFIGVLSFWNFQCFPKEGAKRDLPCLGRVEGNSLKTPSTNETKTNKNQCSRFAVDTNGSCRQSQSCLNVYDVNLYGIQNRRETGKGSNY